MAAYCSCCGAEITLKAEACAACGMPQHGMLPPEQGPVAYPGGSPRQQDASLKTSKTKTR